MQKNVFCGRIERVKAYLKSELLENFQQLRIPIALALNGAINTRMHRLLCLLIRIYGTSENRNLRFIVFDALGELLCLSLLCSIGTLEVPILALNRKGCLGMSVLLWSPSKHSEKCMKQKA